jgi:GDP-L-fucose synthase
MRILITGANGYIGKSLHKALETKYFVTAITRSSFDLTDAVAMGKFFDCNYHFDIVIHCAVVGGSRLTKDDWSIMDKNLTMYYNLLQFRKHYTRLIHFGSGAETYMPNEPYGYSKKVIAKSILNQDNFYNVKIFGVFDESELDTRFIKANIIRYIKKEPIQIYENKYMDFFYMDDLVSIIKYIIFNPQVKEINCSYPQSYSLHDIASLINQLSDYECEIKIEQKGLGKDYIGQYQNLNIPFIGLEKAIKQTYEKINQFLH